MKVIDLLNKIANGEEVKFKLKNDDLTYSIKKGKFLHIEELNTDVEWYIDEEWLNEEVEIIEEDREIKKINTLNNVGNCHDIGELKDKQQLNNHILKDKINEIIDKLNKGR